MKVIVGKNAGFCGGVLNSVTKTNQYMQEIKPLFCLGELVHNSSVINNLKNQGLIFVESLAEVSDNSSVIIRAHGVPVEVYEEAKKRNIRLLDLTCPKVLKIHRQVEEYAKEGYFIIVIAHRNHPEVIGTISYCGKDSFIVESLEDVEEAVLSVLSSHKKKVVIVAQTTFSLELFNDIANQLQGRLHNLEVRVINTICNATMIRQKEVGELAKRVDAMIIIGGKNSSNTKKLFEISNSICKTYLIENVDELVIDKPYSKIGVMAGASTPMESVNEVVEYLNNYESC